MFGNTLRFPALQFVNRERVTLPGGRYGNKLPLYKLDWDTFDQKLAEKHERWRAKHWPDADIPFMPGLPEAYEEKVRKFRFALDGEYQSEIQRCAQLARAEWSMMRHFDTKIREACLAPVISYVKVVFELLSDCIIALEPVHFSRGPERMYGAHALLYKFWCHQTGHGRVRTHAEIDALSERRPRMTKPEDEAVGRFLAALQLHEEHYREVYEAAQPPVAQAK